MADATTKSAVAEQVVANVTTTAPATATPPQHGLHGAFQQPHPSMVAQQLAAMDGSYLTATYPASTYPAETYPASTYPAETYIPLRRILLRRIPLQRIPGPLRRILTCFTRPSRKR